MPTKQAPERVTITLPEEVKDLFSWMKNYDSQFEGRDASIGAFLLKLGAEAYYQRGLENAEPLDEALVKGLDESGKVGLGEALLKEKNETTQTLQKRAR